MEEQKNVVISPRELEKQQKIIRDEKIKQKIQKTMKSIEDSAIPKSKKELYALAANQAKRNLKTQELEMKAK